MIIDSPIISGSLILTGSAAFTGSLTLSGSMNTIGTITATTLVVQTVTSSIDYITGSSINGSLLSNTHLFTGSLYMTGGLYVIDSNIGVNTTAASSPLSLYYPSTGSDINYIKMEMPSWGGSTNFKKNIIWHDSSNVVGAIGMSFTSPYTYMDFHSFYNSAHTTGSLMRIQGNGLIGIGTTAPSFRLSFGGDTATTIGMNQSILGSAPALTLKGADSTTGTNNEGGAINISAGLGTGNGATSNIIFSTGAPGGSGATRQTLTERMRITSTGNVGIGISTPATSYGFTRSLVVSNPTNAEISLEATTSGRVLSMGITSGMNYFQTTAGNGYSIEIGGASKMLIASTGITTLYNTLILGTNSFDGTIQWGTTGYGTSSYTAGNGRFTWLSSAGGVAGTIYYSFNADGFGARMTIANNGNVVIAGALSKGSGSFRIKHPLASKKNTHQLVHSFIEGPQADLIYSGEVTLVDGKAIINIDEAATMTEGTFEALNRNIRVFTSNETSWDNVRGKVIGNILTIESQNTESTDKISWMVIGERQDEHIMDTDWTDSNGKVIVEPLIPEESN